MIVLPDRGWEANVTTGTSARKSLPTIKYGEPCVPGQSYRMDCNRCFCTSAGKLLCTQIACVDWLDKKDKIHKKLKMSARHGKRNKTLKKEARVGKGNKTDKKVNLSADESKANKVLVGEEGKSNKTFKDLTAREGNLNESLKPKKLQKKRAKARQGKNKKTGKTNKNHFLNAKKKVKPLEDLPTGDCHPGRIYKSGCKRCFCDDKGKAQCALKSDACANGDGVIKPISSPEDIRPPFVREELKMLKTLTSASDRCDPGTKYKVSCNLCVCTERGNLLCTKELCLSFEDINRVEAAEKSGEKCTQDPVPAKTGCIECKCVDGKLACTDIQDCVGETRLKLSSGGKNNIQLKLDPMKEKCVPHGIYRDDCNRCYCQQDGSLRCTQKTCLVYSQAEELRRQLKQLKL